MQICLAKYLYVFDYIFYLFVYILLYSTFFSIFILWGEYLKQIVIISFCFLTFVIILILNFAIKFDFSSIFLHIFKNGGLSPSTSISSSNGHRRDDGSISPNEIIVPYYQEEPINVSLEEINSLNIIINSCTVENTFFNDVCQELSNDGIKFIGRSDCIDVYINDAVIITLDQEYSVGEKTIIFAPFQNFLPGNSDALVLSAQTAFYEKGFLIDHITCNNNLSNKYISADTEKDANTSYVTISFGTYNVHAGLTAAAIEATLTRYYSYINEMYTFEDLIYCDVVGNVNINPVTEKIRAFNKHVPTNLYIDKTLWSK